MTPDKVQARKMVLVGVLLLAIIGVYRDRSKETKQGTFRVIWATAVVGLFLSLLADFLPTIAGPFALLIVLGLLSKNGEKTFENILSVVIPQPSAGSGATARSASSSPATTPTPAQG